MTRPAAVIEALAAGEEAAVRLHLNEAPWGPPPSAVRRARAAAERLHLYPIGDTRRATEAAAAHLGIEPERVILTVGVDEATDLCLLELGGLRTVTPGFNGFKDRAAALGRPVEEVPLAPGWRLPPGLLDGLGPDRVVMLASPNNPSGVQFTAAELEALLAAGRPVLLDETYADFAPSAPGRELLDRHPRLLLFRSFSKSYGLGALRVGCLAGEAGMIARLRARQPYYPVDRLAGEVLIAALEDDPEFPARMAARIEPLRASLTRRLRRGGIFAEVVESSANFVLVTCEGEGRARRVQELLHDRGGVLVASAAPFGVPAGLRISVGNEEALATFAEALLMVEEELERQGDR
jgi:histidinol-phosphate aminotransferase